MKAGMKRDEIEWNGTEWNGTERDGTAENGTERNKSERNETKGSRVVRRGGERVREKELVRYVCI